MGVHVVCPKTVLLSALFIRVLGTSLAKRVLLGQLSLKSLPQVTGGSGVPGSQLPQLLMEAGNRRAGPCYWLCRLKGWEYTLLRAWGVPRFTWEAVHRGGRG